MCRMQNAARLHSQKRASCSESAVGLLPCSHQADIRMRSHRLLRPMITSLLLVAKMFDASWLSRFFLTSLMHVVSINSKYQVVSNLIVTVWCNLIKTQVWFNLITDLYHDQRRLDSCHVNFSTNQITLFSTHLGWNFCLQNLHRVEKTSKNTHKYSYICIK